MSNRQLTEDEKKKIVEKIKAHLSDERHSNCRLGKVVKEVTGEYTDAFNNNEVSAMVIRDKKYIRTRDSTDWTITINPDYVETKFITYRDIAIWIFGVIGGVASMLIYDAITKNKQETESTQIRTEQQQQSESVSTVDSTERKIVPSDSSKTN